MQGRDGRLSVPAGVLQARAGRWLGGEVLAFARSTIGDATIRNMRIDVDIEWLAWDDWNREHISKHAVTVDEVEEVISRRTIRSSTYKGRLLLVGSTVTGQMISVVAGPSPGQLGSFNVFTARPASRPERRRYDQETREVEP